MVAFRVSLNVLLVRGGLFANPCLDPKALNFKLRTLNLNTTLSFCMSAAAPTRILLYDFLGYFLVVSAFVGFVGFTPGCMQGLV